MIWTGIELGFGIALGFWLFIRVLRLVGWLFGFSIRSVEACWNWLAHRAESFLDILPHADKRGNPVGWNH